MLWLVGAGPGDPDLVTRRGAELLAGAEAVVADRSLWPLIRTLAPAAGLHEPAEPTAWPTGEVVVRLYPGDGVAVSLVDRAALDAEGRPFDLVPGPADHIADAARSALGTRVAERRPLSGSVIVVTRPVGQQTSLSTPLRRWGADVVEMPTIAIEPPLDGGAALSAAVRGARSYDWVVLTSANGAAALLDRVVDVRTLAGVGVAAIGPATAAVLAGAHLPADLVPATFVAEGLLAAFPPAPQGRPGRVLLVRAEVARDTLPDGLRAAGWSVDVVAAYRTVAATVPEDVRDRAVTADAVLFSSPSTVQQFVARVGPDRLRLAPPAGPTLFAIGPVTADALVAAGLRADVVAERYDVTGLLDAVLRWAKR